MMSRRTEPSRGTPTVLLGRIDALTAQSRRTEPSRGTPTGEDRRPKRVEQWVSANRAFKRNSHSLHYKGDRPLASVSANRAFKRNSHVMPAGSLGDKGAGLGEPSLQEELPPPTGIRAAGPSTSLGEPSLQEELPLAVRQLPGEPLGVVSANRAFKRNSHPSCQRPMISTI